MIKLLVSIAQQRKPPEQCVWRWHQGRHHSCDGNRWHV